MSEPTRLRAAVVGLGQVGMLFDLDPKRDRVWTHFTAYERLRARFDLVAVCDLDPERRRLALARRPSLRAFATIEELLDGEDVDVVSLCTPTDTHAAQTETCAGRVRAVVCEKPLSSDVDCGRRAVETCADAGTLLAVNYYKRFEPAVEEAARLIRTGSVGEIRAATALYAGPVDAVGSHAVDLLSFLLGELDVVHVFRSAAGTNAVFRGDAECPAVLLATGPREDLVFEADILGSEGRLRILDNCERLELSTFAPSTRYGGYRELVSVSTSDASRGEPFLAVLEEVADVLQGKAGGLRSDGASALRTQSILSRLELDGARA